jgi:exodeoxyribonuclease-3
VRFATWNCCSDGARKIDALEAIGVDVAVVCEAPISNPRSATTLLGHDVGWLSTGAFATKGLAIAGIGTPIEPLSQRDGQGQWTVAAQIADGPAVLGVWSRPPKPGVLTYGAQVIASLNVYADLLTAGNMIVAGDFNIGQPAGSLAGNDGSAAARTLWESLGLVSLYHAFFNEPFGGATRSTYFHRRKASAGWHIDYVLIHHTRLSRVTELQVGSHEDWVGTGLSDHVPLIVDFNW